MNINKVAILIKKASLEFDKVSNSIFAEYDLSAAQYKVLMYIYSQESKTARVIDMEREYSITHPTALGLIGQLEKKGFTVRVNNPNDARGKMIALTEKANTMQKELEALGDSVENKLTEHLTDAERKELIALLRKLMNTAD